MRRSCRKIVSAAFLAAMALVAPPLLEAKGKTHAVVGVLQRVDGARINVQTSKGVEVLTVVPATQIHRGASAVRGDNLPSYVGRKVKVRYVDADGRKEIQTIALPSERP